MPIPLPAGYSWDPGLKQGRETGALTALVWPNYLVLESDIPEPGTRVEITEQELLRRFPVWGVRRDSGGELVAFASAVQLAADLAAPALPATGWRFAIEKGLSGERPNCLSLLVANIDPAARGLGLAQILIDRAKLATRELGFSTLIAPVRPTLKHREPMTPMAEYVSRRSESGEIHDPWIAAHARSGGRVMNVCAESVRIRATLAKWREWTGLPLLTSGEHVLPRGLVPLQVDVESNIGIYAEPNVWVRYDLA